MPSRHGPGSYANKRHDICYQKRSKAAACEGTPRIARVSFPHGLASEAQLRSASFVASRCYAINDRGSQFISKDCAASTAQWDTRIRYPEVGLSEALVAIAGAYGYRSFPPCDV